MRRLGLWLDRRWPDWEYWGIALGYAMVVAGQVAAAYALLTQCRCRCR